MGVLGIQLKQCSFMFVLKYEIFKIPAKTHIFERFIFMIQLFLQKASIKYTHQ